MSNYERDFYTVNEDHTITINGWMDERDNNWEGFYDDDMLRHVFTTGDWPDVYEPGEIIVDWALPYQQYNEDLHYEEVEEYVDTFYDGKPGIHLPLKDVNEGTPAGNYWCFYNEGYGYEEEER